MERLEKGVAAAVKPVTKTAQEMFTDAVQSLTGNYNDKQAPQADQAEEAKKIQEVRAKLAQINKEIVEARKKREHPPATPEAQPERAGQEKKVVEKQRKESVLAKMIRSRQGSKEAMQRASG